jgi:hypothetical protein
MKLRLALRRGTVLLQTLIICLLLSYISISITRWVLQRYTGAVRLSKSTTGRVIDTGGVMRQVSLWGAAGSGATSGSVAVGVKTVSFSNSGSRVTFTYDDEN